MTKLIIAITALTACTYSMSSSGLLGSHNADASPSEHASPGGASSTTPNSDLVSGPAIWKRWETRGVRLGMARAELKKQGYTCGKRANSRCYKLVDKRCEKGVCEFKEDAFGQWFELNGAKTKLDFITCATTETDAALVYDIHYYFGPRQLLTDESTLGKAIIAKYGTPTTTDEPSEGDPNGGGRFVIWNPDLGNNGPNVVADCNTTDSPQCNLDVQDWGVVAIEKAKQEKIDKQRMLARQPAAAPEL